MANGFTRIPDFQWEYNKKTEKYKEMSEYKNFSIHIDSNYMWGDGWTEKQHDDFYGEVLFKLENAGFKNISEGDTYSCPIIKGKNSFDKTNVYLHPMEFSGYAKQSDIDKIVDVLQNCDVTIVHSCHIQYVKEVNDMSDVEYKALLIENTANIAKWIGEMKQRGYRDWEMGDTFANYFRIPRVGDRSGLSSLDVDWAFVEDLHKIITKLAEFQEKSMENDDLDERDDR